MNIDYIKIEETVFVKVLGKLSINSHELPNFQVHPVLCSISRLQKIATMDFDKELFKRCEEKR